MAKILEGAPVAEALKKKVIRDAEKLKAAGIEPTLAILRAGEESDKLSYERSVTKCCAGVGVAVRNAILPADAGSGIFFDKLEELNEDEDIHGILILMPIPPRIEERKVRGMICPDKDVDGLSDASLAGVFTGSGVGFAPCTPQAVMEILDFYGIDCAGRRAAVIGRSLVVGRPVSMMLMGENATVTTCHTKTPNVPSIAREADILIACSGQMENVGADYVRPGQVVVDVGIGWSDKKGKLCGDVAFEEAEPIAGALTPVPGGVGVVTSCVMASHVAEAAKNISDRKKGEI